MIINLMKSSASAIWSWQFRIILVGDSTVGKSALLKRFTEGSFAETSDPTVRFKILGTTQREKSTMKIETLTKQTLIGFLRLKVQIRLTNFGTRKLNHILMFDKGTLLLLGWRRLFCSSDRNRLKHSRFYSMSTSNLGYGRSGTLPLNRPQLLQENF